MTKFIEKFHKIDKVRLKVFCVNWSIAVHFYNTIDDNTYLYIKYYLPH